MTSCDFLNRDVTNTENTLTYRFPVAPLSHVHGFPSKFGRIKLWIFLFAEIIYVSWNWTAHCWRRAAVSSSPLMLLHSNSWATVQLWLEDGLKGEQLRTNSHLNNRYILQHQSNWVIRSLIMLCHGHQQHYIMTAMASPSLTWGWACFPELQLNWHFVPTAATSALWDGANHMLAGQSKDRGLIRHWGGSLKPVYESLLLVLESLQCSHAWISLCNQGSRVLFRLALWRPEFTGNDKKQCSGEPSFQGLIIINS